MKDSDHDITDVIVGRPQEFKVGRKSFKLYPVTLAKMLLLKRLMDELSVNMEQMKVNPYLEALRIVRDRRKTCCRILAYHTAPNTYRGLFNTHAIAVRENLLGKGLDDEELATLVILVLTAEKTDAIIEHCGLNKERERMRKVMAVKKEHGRNTMTFNGLTVFGTFIARLKEMGYTDNEILYERGYSYLRLMLADKVVDIMLTDEERRKLYEADGGELMDANAPQSAAKITEYFAQKDVVIN